MMAISAEDLKPNVRALAGYKMCQISGKIKRQVFLF
jgi:hypothetical protein